MYQNIREILLAIPVLCVIIIGVYILFNRHENINAKDYKIFKEKDKLMRVISTFIGGNEHITNTLSGVIRLPSYSFLGIPVKRDFRGYFVLTDERFIIGYKDFLTDKYYSAVLIKYSSSDYKRYFSGHEVTIIMSDTLSTQNKYVMRTAAEEPRVRHFINNINEFSSYETKRYLDEFYNTAPKIIKNYINKTFNKNNNPGLEFSDWKP